MIYLIKCEDSLDGSQYARQEDYYKPKVAIMQNGNDVFDLFWSIGLYLFYL